MNDLKTNAERYNYLISLGNHYPLDIRFDSYLINKELQPIEAFWRPYNRSKPMHRREGLSLISLNGETDGLIDLNSLREYHLQTGIYYDELSFRQPTPLWPSLTSITQQLEALKPSLGRSHLIRFQEGGFFPPHRDLGSAFRLISVLNCSSDSLHFCLDTSILQLTKGQLYFVNTRLTHSLISYTNNATILVLNVEPNKQAFDFMMAHLVAK